MKAGFISTSNAGKLLGKGDRQVRRMCEAGIFRTACKTGLGTNSWWQVSKHEILVHVQKSHPHPIYA